MDALRQYSTIGIEGFVSGPSNQLPSSYLQQSSDAPTSSRISSFTSWEITGTVKEIPEDFEVREILPDNRIAKVVSHYNAVNNSEGDGDRIANNHHPISNIATMPSRPPITLKKISNVPPNQLKVNPTGCETVVEQSRKKTIVGENVPSIAKPAVVITAPDCPLDGNSVLPEMSLDETIRTYIEKVATLEHPGAALLNSIEALNEKAIKRIPTYQNYNEAPVTATLESDASSSVSLDSMKIWIPPLHLPEENVEKVLHTNDNNFGTATVKAISDSEMRAQRKAFHRAIRILYPFLKTESSTCNPSNHEGLSKSTGPTKQPTNEDKNHVNGDHWIKISIDDCFDELVQYLDAPRDHLTQLYLFRNLGFAGTSPQSKSAASGIDATKPSSFVILRLRPGASKDDRRTVHHILALKNKHFESSVRHQGSKKKTCPRVTEKEDKNATSENSAANTTDLVVSWKKQALRKGKKTKKRKRYEDGKGGDTDFKHDQNLLCVLKKTQKEHLTTMQILSRNLKCRQSDIGFAGIKGK